MNNLTNFGIYTALTIIFAFLADCLIAPALIAVLMKQKTCEWRDYDSDQNRKQAEQTG